MSESPGLGRFVAALVDQNGLRLAVAGDGAGALDVPDRPNYIYARMGDGSGAVEQVHVSVIHPNYGDAIYIKRDDPLQLGGWRMEFWLRDSADPTREPPITGSARGYTYLADADGNLLTDADGNYLIQG